MTFIELAKKTLFRAFVYQGSGGSCVAFGDS
jgi:hypothetical protein